MRAIIKFSIGLFSAFSLAAGFTACQPGDEVAPAPTISRVRTVSRDSVYTYQAQYNLDSVYPVTRTIPVTFDSTTMLGRPGMLYAILGSNLRTVSAVYFNDVNAYFNPALVTDNSILVSIPLTTPFTGTNRLRVVTAGGSAEMDFSIQQPAPVITGVDQLAGQAGDIITISGTTFDNVTTVRFGTATAEITAKSATELTVKVPESVTAVAIAVTTPGGTTTYSIPFGFGYALFEDTLIPGWTATGFNGTATVPSKGVVKRGTASMQYDYTGGFGGFQNFISGTPINLASYRGLKLSLYGGPGSDGKVVKVVLNGSYDTGRQLLLRAGVWTTFAIPLTDLGVTTGTLTEVTFQEFSGNVPETIYIDDLGLY